ncbi:DMT family transporter [Heyndrickxia acidiproducens]|uniref:DMT family transporter n=1 Tax=Heyndrickxia acidiproducens TaxID=1121084 RepID=UPI00037BD0A4|nr:multidrug efflux SMR transporter [Heyndrickxia acidiproducens]
MNSAWIKVFIGVCFEVLWVIGLKHAGNFLEWGGTLLSISASFYALLSAAKTLPSGTVYAVFVGLGTAGTAISEIVFFGEPFDTVKIVLILILLTGVIGLKIVTEEKTDKGADA